MTKKISIDNAFIDFFKSKVSNSRENVKFYKCTICGNIVQLTEGNMDYITCCGKPMEEMKANT